LRARLKELASQRRRFGYRRLRLLLARQGIRINRKKLYRLYKEERLTVRKHGELAGNLICLSFPTLSIYSGFT
jgi:putative transposase